jgi:hypothetical protein
MTTSRSGFIDFCVCTLSGSRKSCSTISNNVHAHNHKFAFIMYSLYSDVVLT